MKKSVLILIFTAFAFSAFSANRNTSKSQKYRAMYGKCSEKYPNNEEDIFKCMKEERLAAIRAATAKNAP